MGALGAAADASGVRHGTELADVALSVATPGEAWNRTHIDMTKKDKNQARHLQRSSEYFFSCKGAVSCSYCVAISAWCGHKGGHKGGMAKPSSASVTTAEEPNFDTDFTMAQQLIDMTAEEHGGESVCRQGIAGVCALRRSRSEPLRGSYTAVTPS